MSAVPISVSADALTLTWVVVGSLILELLVLIVFLVRIAWWLARRFALLDATQIANVKEINDIKADVSNDIAGRRVVAEARTDIAQMKATLGELRERIDRLENNEDGRRRA
jgi:hypothetical protein